MVGTLIDPDPKLLEVPMRRIIVLVGCLSVLLIMQATASDNYLAGFEVPADAEYIGSEDCTMCHEDIGEFYKHSAHSVERNLLVPGTEIGACEACHGPGSLHVDEDGDGWIITADDMSHLGATDRAAMCTQCHNSMDLHFAGSDHAGTEVSCATCHGDQVHFGSKVKPAAEFRSRTEFCLQCHTEVVAAFRLPFRHRVLEGEMSCADCHDHHKGNDTASWENLNDGCLSCHPQIAGPFVFEHEGVDGEECLSCHKPHGSHNDKLLTQDGNGLCLQCHFEAGFNSDGNWNIGGVNHSPAATGQESRCYDCHREIHGSNISPSFKDQ